MTQTETKVAKKKWLVFKSDFKKKYRIWNLVILALKIDIVFLLFYYLLHFVLTYVIDFTFPSAVENKKFSSFMPKKLKTAQTS